MPKTGVSLAAIQLERRSQALAILREKEPKSAAPVSRMERTSLKGIAGLCSQDVLQRTQIEMTVTGGK